MKKKYFYFLLFAFLLLLSCSDPKLDNPFDPENNPSITNIQFERISVNQLKLVWEYNFDSTEGQLHIDKKVGNNDFQNDYAIISLTENEWVDTNAEVNEALIYKFRAVFDQNSIAIETTTFYNDIPVPENFTFEILYSNKVPLIWNYNLSGIDGFEIYRQIGSENWEDVGIIYYNQSWIFNDYSFSYGEDYHYKICAFYDELYSVYSDELILNISEISWDNGENYVSIGNNESVDFDVASRYNTSDLTQYDGMYLIQVDFFPQEYNCEYSIRVWTGGNISGGEGNSGTQVVDQTVINPNINQWNRIRLDNPVHIDSSEELWFGYRCNTQTGFPAGCDEGPAIEWKGDLIYWNNVWQRLVDTAEEGVDLNYNWNIKGVINNVEN